MVAAAVFFAVHVALAIIQSRPTAFWMDDADVAASGATMCRAQIPHHDRRDGRVLRDRLRRRRKPMCRRCRLPAGHPVFFEKVRYRNLNNETRWVGAIDEVRVSTALPVDEAIRAEYINQNDPGLGGFFAELGPQEAAGTTWLQPE